MLQTPRRLAAILTLFFLAGSAGVCAETLTVTKLADTAAFATCP